VLLKNFYGFLWEQVLLLGSNANNGSTAGVFYVNANNASSNDNVNIGGQLCLKS